MDNRSSIPVMRVRCTIPALAKQWGMSRRTCFDWLRALRNRDIKRRGTCPWWLQAGPMSPIRINLGVLKRTHAAEFESSVASQEDLDELRDRVDELEEALERISRRQRLADRGEPPLHAIQGRPTPPRNTRP